MTVVKASPSRLVRHRSMSCVSPDESMGASPDSVPNVLGIVVAEGPFVPRRRPRAIASNRGYTHRNGGRWARPGQPPYLSAMIDPTEQQARRDLQYLAGSSPHRGAYTGNEHAAAEYLQRRFEEYTSDTELDELSSIESYYYLFASYYAELFVAIAAVWFSAFRLRPGCFYRLHRRIHGYLVDGAVPAAVRVAECRYAFFRLGPRLFVVTAHYDSPREGFLSSPRILRRLRSFHSPHCPLHDGR